MTDTEKKENKNKRTEYAKKYRLENKEKLKEKRKIYYIKNKDKIKEYSINNKEKKKDYSKLYFENNKEKLKEKAKKYRENNSKEIKKKKKELYQINKTKIIEKNKEWYKNNKEQRNKYRNNKKQTDPLFKLRCNISSLILLSIKKQGYTKNSKSYQILGCTFEEFKNHLERQFTNGMNWENQGEWHLDHIYPVSLAKDEQELIRLNHYTNFQPMWAIENIIKSNKVIPNTQIKLI